MKVGDACRGRAPPLDLLGSLLVTCDELPAQVQRRVPLLGPRLGAAWHGRASNHAWLLALRRRWRSCVTALGTVEAWMVLSLSPPLSLSLSLSLALSPSLSLSLPLSPPPSLSLSLSLARSLAAQGWHA